MCATKPFIRPDSNGSRPRTRGYNLGIFLSLKDVTTITPTYSLPYGPDLGIHMSQFGSYGTVADTKVVCNEEGR